MSKTPEEMAQQYVSTIADTHSVKAACEKAFFAGYKAAQEQLADADKVMPDTCEHILDMEKMVDVNGWVSVKDRLPELRQEVLVWYDNGYEVAYLQKFEPPKLQYPQFNNVEMFEWCFGDFEDFDVTHWMPLPEPPKEEE